MDFPEIEGERCGSKFLTTEDHHIYRYAFGPKAPNLQCYLDRITKTMEKISPDVKPCKATAVIKDGKIQLLVEHNHDPDERIYGRLSARKVVRETVATSSQPSRAAFDEAMRDHPGAELVAWGEIYRTCLRDRRETYPPPPEDCAQADKFMQDEQYRDKTFSKFYQGIVTGKENEYALVFAHPQNLEKLDENTKQINADGTFRTAPALKVGHLYQILIILAMYKEHLFPVIKAIMTNKTRSLYDAVFSKVKSLLPEIVKPVLVICDYEPALMGGLSMIFPLAEVSGCWFHFSQAVFKYMCGLGLKEQFAKNPGFAKWMKMIMALPLLPTSRISGMWADLKREAIPNMHGIPKIPVRALNRFKKYMEKTWIVGKLDVLSVYKQESRTNNHSEVYNKKWNSRVQVTNPNMWKLGETIFAAFMDVEKEMGRLDNNLTITRPKARKNVLNARRLQKAEEKL